jgi:alcohol dehydrogenase (cytochrome c)
MGGTSRGVPGESAEKSLRAIDIHTGEIVFDIPQGPALFGSSAGLMTTATGLVIFGENSGMFMAADGATGEVLWKYNGNQGWRSSPMAYEFDGRQYIAVAVGRSIMAFALPESAVAN